MFPVDEPQLTLDEAILYSLFICLLIIGIWFMFLTKEAPKKALAEDANYPSACDLTSFELHSGKCRNAEKIGGKISCGNPNCKHF